MNVVVVSFDAGSALFSVNGLTASVNTMRVRQILRFSRETKASFHSGHER